MVSTLMPGDRLGRIRSELTDPRPRWSWPDFGAKARAPHTGPVSSQPHCAFCELPIIIRRLGT